MRREGHHGEGTAPGVALCMACAAADQIALASYRTRVSQIVLTTGDIRREYDIVDIVMALEADQNWSVAWSRIAEGLRAHALRLSSDAVIHIRAEHRVYAEPGRQGVEFFACGTVVRFRRAT